MQKLTPHGPITSRAMFGGYGIFFNKVIFACIVNDELYFRVDEKMKGELEKMGSHPFIYEGKNKPIAMPYFTLPTKILNDAKTLPLWIDRAYRISAVNKNQKSPKRRSA